MKLPRSGGWSYPGLGAGGCHMTRRTLLLRAAMHRPSRFDHGATLLTDGDMDGRARPRPPVMGMVNAVTEGDQCGRRAALGAAGAAVRGRGRHAHAPSGIMRWATVSTDGRPATMTERLESIAQRGAPVQ